MPVFIESIGCATPEYCIEQNNFPQSLKSLSGLSEEKTSWLNSVCQQSGIKNRYSVLPDFSEKEKAIFGKGTPPSASARHAIFNDKAPQLALQAVKSLETERQSITHIIGVTCTGVMAPGIEAKLMTLLELDPTIERLGINFMGCFGAFKGLAAATSLVRENPSAKVLVVCCELCTLHFHDGEDPNSLIANTLFADGAACAIVSSKPGKWEIIKRQSEIIPNSADQMTWESGDNHFLMTLSPKIPKSIYRNILPFVKKLCGDIPVEECAFAVHPGGKAILQAVERACKLSPSQTTASWEVMENYGNMSSPTFLFVLDRVKSDHPYCIGLGFGPGLSVEGTLMRRSQ